MSITRGIYIIHPADADNKGLGIGPVPLLYPPPPVPLRILSGQMIDKFTVRPANDDTFTFVSGPRGEGYGIGQGPEDAVFVKYNQEDGHVSWSVEPGSGPGKYRIKLPNEDKYWTAGDEDDFPPIKLQSANGSAAQEWVLLRLE